MADAQAITYRAFLSYSHADTKMARRLHARLEDFRIDTDLIGRRGAQSLSRQSCDPAALVGAYPDNSEWQHDLAVAEEKIGDVQQAQGDVAAAIASYQASLAIRNRLAAAGGNNSQWELERVSTYGKLATVYLKAGDKPKVLDALRQGQAIIARLAKLSPDNAALKKTVALFDTMIATLTK